MNEQIVQNVLDIQQQRINHITKSLLSPHYSALYPNFLTPNVEDCVCVFEREEDGEIQQ